MGRKLKALNLSKNWRRCLGLGKEASALRMFFTTLIFLGATSLYARKDYFDTGNSPWSDLMFLAALFLGLIMLIAPFLCLLAGLGLNKAPRAVFVVSFLITSLVGLGLSSPGIVEFFGNGKLEIYCLVGLFYSFIAVFSLIAYNRKLKKGFE